jgi:hypothetical protein
VRARELTVDEAERPLDWRYPGRYATYDARGPLGGDRGFFAVEDEGDLVGFGCVGAEARVPGVEEEPGTIDVGYGMRPDLVGQGARPLVRRSRARSRHRAEPGNEAAHVHPPLERPVAPGR